MNTANANTQTPSLQTIAERVGRSVTTVSLALSGSPRVSRKTRDRVFEAAVEIGYRSPQEIRARWARSDEATGRCRLALLVCGGSGGDVLLELTGALNERLDPDGLRLEIASLPPIEHVSSWQSMIQSLRGEIDVFVVMHLVPEALLQWLLAEDIPFILCGAAIAGDSYDATERYLRVDVDQQRMGRVAVGYLHAMGHRRIGLLRPPGHPGLYFSRWHDGYRLGHFDAGLALDPTLQAVIVRSREVLSKTVDSWFSLDDPPTAFVLPDGVLAADFMELAGGHGVRMDPSNTVVGGTPRTAGKFGLHGLPILEPDWTAMATWLSDMARRLASGERPPARSCMLPVLRHNFLPPPS